MVEKKLSEELRFCMETEYCGNCQYDVREATLTRPGLLQKAYEVIKGYEDLEERGRLLGSPCAVGDTVYEVQGLRGRIQPYTIISVHISKCGNLYGWELKDGKGIYGNLNGFSEYALGKSVFLTPQEAEAKLAEMEERNDGE